MSGVKPKVHCVLVRSKVAGNIGAAARATANISENGKLILIAPRTSINSQSRKMAAGAQDVLDQHESYESWTKFSQNHPLGIRLGLTRRSGKQRKPMSLPEAIQRSLSVPENQSTDIYLIFGPEEDGLNSDDIDQCHMTCFLPAYGAFKSLNLAQAVILAHYITQQNLEKIVYGKDSYSEGTLNAFVTLNQQGHNLFPDDTLMAYLKMIFPETADQSVSTSFEILRRMILRSTPTNKELELFHLTLKKCLEIGSTSVNDTEVGSGTQ